MNVSDKYDAGINHRRYGPSRRSTLKEIASLPHPGASTCARKARSGWSERDDPSSRVKKSKIRIRESHYDDNAGNEN